MNKDALYFHFANLGLVIIGILSIYKMVGPIIAALLVLGSIGGFLFSWRIKNARPPHIDTFIGMLSLASAVVVLGSLYEVEINFENLLRIFSTVLVWLSLFQAFGLKAQKSYSLLQFISAALLISSVSLALEQETAYVLYLVAFLFTFIFVMRLDLVCEKQNRGSVIIGDRDEAGSLWHQIKVGAIMFSIILILSTIMYPAVPRFNSLSLGWIPSSLLTLPEHMPFLKLLENANKTVHNKKVKKEQLVKDGIKKRETKGGREDEKKEEETIARFNASDFKKDIDALKIELLVIRGDKNETMLNKNITLSAELKMTDGSSISATKLADWKVAGTAKVSIDKNGTLTPKEAGSISVSATYLGTFSNELIIKIAGSPLVDTKKKRGLLFYILIFLLWFMLWIILGVIAIFLILVFIRSKKLANMCKNNPKEFIKEVYAALCKAFKIYGIPKLDYVSYREFYGIAKKFISAKPEPMQILTEEFLEARFSSHEISAKHSQKAIQLFHDIKDVILEKEEENKFWKGFLFRLNVLDVLLIPKQ